MTKIIFIALIAFGYWQWKTNDGGAADAKAFDASGKPIAVIYTVAECGHACDMVLEDMNKRKVDYKLIEVDMQDQESDSYRAWENLDIKGFPILQIGKDSVVGYESSDIRRVVANNFGNDYLTPKEKYYYKRHFDANGNPQVALYGTTWCGYCKKLREDLNDAGIPFEDIEAEINGETNKDMAEAMQISGYPTVYVGFKRIHGEPFSQIKAALKS